MTSWHAVPNTNTVVCSPFQLATMRHYYSIYRTTAPAASSAHRRRTPGVVYSGFQVDTFRTILTHLIVVQSQRKWIRDLNPCIQWERMPQIQLSLCLFFACCAKSQKKKRANAHHCFQFVWRLWNIDYIRREAYITMRAEISTLRSTVMRHERVRSTRTRARTHLKAHQRTTHSARINRHVTHANRLDVYQFKLPKRIWLTFLLIK